MLIYLCAKNDAQGNPRRAWAQFISQQIVSFYEEGFAGCEAVPDGLRDECRNAPRINVSVGEWLSWRDAAMTNP
tara:strand:- start:279 stop:500 length:222 start_codon:yes stop_codon:yes gene_type:complete